VNLWARLQMVECLEFNLHELILSGYELLYLRGCWFGCCWPDRCTDCSLCSPCKRFLTREIYVFLESKPRLYAMIFINLYLKDEVMDKVLKHPMTHIEH
jgi:hypothetical protein